MTYQNNDKAQAIMQIQQFLRTLQITNGDKVTVPVDGIYDSKTKDAVREFQIKSGLPATGTVDKKTYDLLYEKNLDAEFEQSEPLPLYIFQNGQSVKKGEKSDFVMLLQIMLNALTIAYDDFAPVEITGIFEDETENAVRAFQSRNNVPPSGIVDKQTWNLLVINYNKHNQNQ